MGETARPEHMLCCRRFLDLHGCKQHTPRSKKAIRIIDDRACVKNQGERLGEDKTIKRRLWADVATRRCPGNF